MEVARIPCEVQPTKGPARASQPNQSASQPQSRLASHSKQASQPAGRRATDSCVASRPRSHQPSGEAAGRRGALPWLGGRRLAGWVVGWPSGLAGRLASWLAGWLAGCPKNWIQKLDHGFERSNFWKWTIQFPIQFLRSNFVHREIEELRRNIIGS